MKEESGPIQSSELVLNDTNQEPTNNGNNSWQKKYDLIFDRSNNAIVKTFHCGRNVFFIFQIKTFIVICYICVIYVLYSISHNIHEIDYYKRLLYFYIYGTCRTTLLKFVILAEKVYIYLAGYSVRSLLFSVKPLQKFQVLLVYAVIKLDEFLNFYLLGLKLMFRL